jgi:hypothetical protein
MSPHENNLPLKYVKLSHLFNSKNASLPVEKIPVRVRNDPNILPEIVPKELSNGMRRQDGREFSPEQAIQYKIAEPFSEVASRENTCLKVWNERVG